MVKAVYVLKIFLVNGEFVLTIEQLVRIKVIYIFIQFIQEK